MSAAACFFNKSACVHGAAVTVAAAKAAGAAGKVLYQGEFGGPSPNFTGPSVEDVAYPVSILDAQVQSAQDSGAFVLSTIWAWECPSHRSQMICIWPNSSRANESGSDHMVSVLRRVNAEMAPASEDGGSTGVASFDVLVYSATSGGVAAAVAASRHGLKVGMLVANGGGCGPTDAGANHIGGMSSGGLGKTDLVGDSGKLIGGIAAEFYSSNARHYNTTAPPSYNHEPHVAQRTFDELLASSTVSVIRGGHGANVVSAQKRGRVIESITVADGRKFAAEVFIDSSYEGDLMAAAGASYTVGREAASVYNESLAGRRPDDFSNNGYELRCASTPSMRTASPSRCWKRSPTAPPLVLGIAESKHTTIACAPPPIPDPACGCPSPRLTRHPCSLPTISGSSGGGSSATATGKNITRPRGVANPSRVSPASRRRWTRRPGTSATGKTVMLSRFAIRANLKSITVAGTIHSWAP